jgi:predicted phage baseplate assembly protein
VARADLLGSEADERHFVVETDDEGGASLRFGNGVEGMAPEAGERFRAFYRVGGGARGNIGADSLRHVVFRNAFPEGLEIEVGNPLPMQGGREPETSASARLRAPSGFRRRLERAITADDYATIVMRDFPALVQRAAATLRSSGLRTEVQVAVDPVGRAEPPEDLLACIERHLERYRRIEHDVRVVPARQVPIDLEVEICVLRGAIAEDVAERVRVRLGSGPGGFFHPDALTFGGGIAVSRLVAAAHAVEGGADVRVTILNRLYEPPDGEIEAGLLPIAPTEIARLDQDRDAPWNGRLNLVAKGGR